MNSKPRNPDVILDVKNVWKIYCRNLKQSMWYGLKDLGREITGGGVARTSSQLRPGEFCAVQDATFQVRRGECVAMIGPNGAGKSTMLKMINGLIRPNSGEIKIAGKVGALIELGTGFNPILSGRENIYVNAAVLGMSAKQVDRVFDDIVDFAELGHVINDPIKTYSTGMRVRLGFAVAANLRPTLLIIDEVLAVGDVGFRMKCLAHLNKLAEEGSSIILVTHAVGMLQRVADRAVVFGQGKIIHDGDLETGCSLYEQVLGASDRTAAAKADLPGNVANIGDVDVLNEMGEVQEEFETGETVQVRIRLNSHELIKNARLIVALRSPVHGVLCSVSTPYQDVKFDVPEGGCTVTVSFPKIPLMIGAYHFNISLYGPETIDFYHRGSLRGNFRIVGPPTNANGYGILGTVKLDHQWQIDG